MLFFLGYLALVRLAPAMVVLGVVKLARLLGGRLWAGLASGALRVLGAVPPAVRGRPGFCFPRPGSPLDPRPPRVPRPHMPRPSTQNTRVLIRPPRPADAGPLTALAEASRAFHAGWVNPARTPEQFAAYLERNRGDDFEAFVLVRRTDSAPLGEINLSQIFRRGFQSAYLGYWIGAPYARQGYMREGLALVLDQAFDALGLHRLEANLQPGNTASRALVQRLGFHQEGYSPRYLKIAGRWRDHERWAILREEWWGEYHRLPPSPVGAP